MKQEKSNGAICIFVSNIYLNYMYVQLDPQMK